MFRKTDAKTTHYVVNITLCAVRHVEAVCKNEDFSVKTSRKCKHYIITRALGNAHSRQARAGIKMLEYFNREEALLTGNMSVNISSDIFESTFGKKSRTNPLQKTINFKERIVNVKLKDISTWATEHLSKNWVTERTKTLRKVS